MLGNGAISAEDIQQIDEVYKNYFPKLPSQQRCLDIAAGIGRVTEQLLTHYFKTTDLLDLSQKFLK